MQTNESKPKCLLCENTDNLRRGLCVTHYEQYRVRKLSLPEDERPAYDELAISRGLLLPSKQGQRYSQENKFDLLIREMRESNFDIDAIAAQKRAQAKYPKKTTETRKKKSS